MNTNHILVAAILSTIAPVALAGQAPPELAQAVQARDQAIDQLDITAWLRLTAPDFTVIDDAGHLMTRLERLFELRSAAGPGPIRAYKIGGLVYAERVNKAPAPSSIPCLEDRTTVLANGDAAVRRCFDGGSWRTEIWAMSDSEWQAVAVQGVPKAN